MQDNISVVIPTYNERESIEDIINTVSQELSALKEIIVVDDDSRDMTWQRVREFGKNNNKIILIRRLCEKGLPQAIWEGIIKAQGEIVLWLDADFLSLPLTLKKLLDNLDSHDIIVASRYVRGGQDKRRERIRVIASFLFNQLARFILGANTKDLSSGCIIARKGIFNKIKISGLYGEYCVRLLYQAEKKNMRIKEVPYLYLSRKKGSSKTSGSPFLFVKYGLTYILTVFKLKLLY